MQLVKYGMILMLKFRMLVVFLFSCVIQSALLVQTAAAFVG